MLRDQDIPDDFIATLKDKNVSVISTLAREEAMFAFAMASFTDNPFFQKALTPERIAILKNQEARRTSQRSGAADLPVDVCDRQAQPEEAGRTPGSNCGSAPTRVARQPLLVQGCFGAPPDGADA